MSTRSAADRARPDGRTRLLDTAEELLDRHGIDGVSVRAVTKASGHRNSSAVNYHFGSREQLVTAVLARRQAAVEERRMHMLDALESSRDQQPREAIAAAVVPLVELLASVEGRRYLRLLHQAANHPGYYRRSIAEYSPSIIRGWRVVAPLVEHLPEELRHHRFRLGIGMAVAALAEQSRLIDASDPPRPPLAADVFAADLIDAVVGALRA